MREGYIVWNQTNYGDGYEFFGVYRSPREALKLLRRVVKNRYGKCPREYDDILDFLAKNDNGEDSIRITYFRGKDRL